MDDLRILIADDHPHVRKQLAARLRRENGIRVIAEASDSQETLELALASRPDVVLVDPIMRDGKGLDVLRLVRKQLPETVVVVLTAYVDASLQIELQKLGVANVVVKGLESRYLVDLLHGVSRSTSETRENV